MHEINGYKIRFYAIVFFQHFVLAKLEQLRSQVILILNNIQQCYRNCGHNSIVLNFFPSLKTFTTEH